MQPISLLHPFQLIVDEKKEEPIKWQWFEPGFELENKRKTSTFVPVCPRLLRTFEAVRTFYAQNDINVMLPDLQNDIILV